MALRLEVACAISELQSRQLGLVTAEQVHGAGAYDGWLRKEIAARRLRRVRRGVYALMSAPATYDQCLLAAVLASGTLASPAAASHETAADALRLLPAAQERPPIEVTTTLDRKPVVDGVRLHRSGHLTSRDVCCVGLIAVTKASRTIIDLSMRFDTAALGRMLDDALRRRLLTLGQLQTDARRLSPAPGRSIFRVFALVIARTGEEASESRLEEYAIAALDRFRIRRPTQQHPVRARRGRRRRVDLCYPDNKIVVEVLGYEYHGLRSRFDDDAVRNNELVRAGYTPLFVTSAMTDWEIAVLVAEAIGEPAPPRPQRELTFQEWSRY